jgi:23S rRNA (cytosine1962-C5)-methyltransferase
MFTVTLKPSREKSLLRRHPWVFSGAIARLDGEPASGATVRVENAHGEFMAVGAYSPESQIRVRVWSWEPNTVIDADFFRAQIKTALRYRESLYLDSAPTALRMIHAESDDLPGLIVDRYADVLVMQVLSAGPERWKETLTDILLELTDARHIYERSDVAVRKLEGLAQRVGPLRGNPPAEVLITENGLKFAVNFSQGHKTGYYVDQRENRQQVRELVKDKDVLDCFSYTGGFTLNALRGGAQSVMTIDSSGEALSLARKNIEQNNLSLDKVEFLEADIFYQLRKFRDQARQFDVIILDPPKFAPTISQAKKAARGYKDINLLAFKLLRPGGMLVTFSCSGGISADLFQKIVAGAALDAGVNAKIVAHMEQSSDHPVALNFPEGAYLKGLVINI